MASENFRVIINEDSARHNRFDMEFFDLWGAAGITRFNLLIGRNVAYYDSKVADSSKGKLI